VKGAHIVAYLARAARCVFGAEARVAHRPNGGVELWGKGEAMDVVCGRRIVFACVHGWIELPVVGRRAADGQIHADRSVILSSA